MVEMPAETENNLQDGRTLLFSVRQRKGPVRLYCTYYLKLLVAVGAFKVIELYRIALRWIYKELR